MRRIERSTPEWQGFVQRQKRRIKARLRRYKDVGMAKVELAELGKLTPYRFYKTETISPILTMVLSNIESGKEYGLCVVCGGDIPIKRLELVPAALACVGCDEKR